MCTLLSSKQMMFVVHCFSLIINIMDAECYTQVSSSGSLDFEDKLLTAHRCVPIGNCPLSQGTTLAKVTPSLEPIYLWGHRVSLQLNLG